MDTTPAPVDSTPAAPEPTGSATYCPEDNKLRLYVGRVPREEYLKLRAEGWTALHKQRETGGGDFAATWTPERRDTALTYAGAIDDEDKGPEERAADRAERFGGYRDKRTNEATGQADRYEAGPTVHGFQNQARAERSAARHERVAVKACDIWSKAEYWTRRTAGVISHALYKSSPAVRMGRIKELEAQQRKTAATVEDLRKRFKVWTGIAAMPDASEQTKRAEFFAGNFYHWSQYQHPTVPTVKASLYSLLTLSADPITGAQAAALYLSNHCDPDSPEFQETRIADWANHYTFRLAYENQMMEAQGGRAASVEMVAGGFICGKQIQKVNRSSVSGRVVSVAIWGTHTGFSKASGYTKSETMRCLVNIETERMAPDDYCAPTAEELEAFNAGRTAAKAAAPKKEPCPLVNPTDADALKLQEIWNKAERSTYATPQAPVKMTFAQYEGRGKAVTVCEDGTEHRSHYGSNITRSDVFKVRSICGDNYSARRVVILTDKPQKEIPWKALAKARASHPTPETMRPKLAEIQALVTNLQGYRQRTHEEQNLLTDARYVGWLDIGCQSPQWTAAGEAERAKFQTAHA